MTTQELIDFYVNLLIIQYATQPSARAMVDAFVAMLIQNQIYGQVGDAFKFAVTPIGPSFDSAAGVQLEAVASYRGAQRVYYGLVPKSYFELADAGDPDTYDANGFMEAADPTATTWFFLLAQDNAVPIYALTDDELYRLTQLRAQVQKSDFGLEDIDRILELFFGDNVAILDNENMTILYVDLLSDPDTLFGIAAISKSLPRPAGVQAIAIRAEMLTNFFGLQDALSAYDPSFSGFSDAETTLTTGTFISAP